MSLDSVQAHRAVTDFPCTCGNLGGDSEVTELPTDRKVARAEVPGGWIEIEGAYANSKHRFATSFLRGRSPESEAWSVC